MLPERAGAVYSISVMLRPGALLALAPLTLLLGCPDDPTPPVTESWALAASALPEALLAVGGTSSKDVWVVGADKGTGPIVLRFDGAAWSRLETGERANLWWVHAIPGGPVFLGGAHSTILRYADGRFERMPTPGLSRHIVFGLWGAAANDVYAVGSVGSRNGFVWHWDGAAWTPVELPTNLFTDAGGNTPGFFKVWGDGKGTVWVVGEHGTVLRSKDRGPFELVPSGRDTTIFTVGGTAERVVFVGGSGGQPALFELGSSGALEPVSVSDTTLLQGTTVTADGRAFACGASGAVYQRSEAGWSQQDLALTLGVQSLHAMWAAPDGGVWAVGGNVLGAGLDKGVIVRLASAAIPTYVAPPPPTPPSTECPAAAVDPKPDGSIARRWSEQLLNAIRRDIPRPGVHARNLFHVSVAMYDAWASFDADADGYLYTDKHTAADVAAARQEAISYASYRVLMHRYNEKRAIGWQVSQDCFGDFMTKLGYDPADTTATGDTPRAIGNRIAQRIIDARADDGANEGANYADTTGYMAKNAPLKVDEGGNQLVDPSVWQELILAEAETQNGLPIGAGVQGYIGSSWGKVAPFAMTRSAPDALYHDPGPAPVFGPAMTAWVVDVIGKHARLDPTLTSTIDISPGAYGNNPIGTNAGRGHPTNPSTGRPYAPNVVKLGDFARVLAEYWADGPKSETPPGHWYKIANDVSDDLTELKLGGSGPALDRLEWDVKIYLAVTGATHDAAITAWEVKRRFLAARPISVIRYKATLGQSSDPSLPSYHADGLPLVPGLIELITEASSRRGERHAHLQKYRGQVAVRSWRGEPGNRKVEYGGVGWIRGAEWMPYQRRSFVTPAFPGFISGHSTFSRAAAEVLTRFTGSPYFPGGLGEFTARRNAYLVFETGPSADLTLQWGTFYDAADQAGQSRLWGGIHIEPDDLVGRRLGGDVGVAAFTKAVTYFDGTAR